MPSLWILEDEISPFNHFQRVFTDSFQVECFRSPESIRIAIEAALPSPDVLVAHFGMSSVKHEETLMSECRHREIPFIAIFNTDDTEVLNGALQKGARDVFVKPVNTKELHFKVQKLLAEKRHTGLLLSPKLPDLTLDTDSQRLFRRSFSEGISLTPTEYRILFLFFTKLDAPLDRTKIISGVWARLIRSSKVFDFHLSRLREKLRAHSVTIEYAEGGNYHLRVD